MKKILSNIFQISRTISQIPNSLPKLFALCLACGLYAHANPANKKLDIDIEREGWLVDLTRVSVNFSSTKITNQDPYAQFANSRLSGDSQLIMQFYGYVLADYYSKRFVFFNSLLAEYGETMVFLSPKKRLRNKTLDRILFSTGYTQRIWKLDKIGGGEIGPYAQLSLQGEFTPSPNLPYRKKFFRFAAGVRLFDGKYVENLKLNLFGEEDFSDVHNLIESMGVETGLSLKRMLREGVQFSSLLNYRYYIINNYPNLRNPEHELECNIRLDTTLWNSFTISPFISFYLLKGRYINKPASNLFIGVSLSYGKVLKNNKIKEPQATPTPNSN